jgi:riboflavin synthase
MFTGLIERTGTISGIESRGNGAKIAIAACGWSEPLAIGESISVSGACLTVSEVLPGGFSADLLRETLDLTSLKAKRNGSRVNLERALKAGDRLGGHIVSGHIDGVGRLFSVRKTGADHIARVACTTSLMDEIVKKGSVALDGISLTVTTAGDDWFEVHIIPHTWEETSLSSCCAGDLINIETDIIAKYVRKYTHVGSDASFLDKMKRAGFA